LKKKNQKTFAILVRSAATSRDSRQKFFASFFQKRRAFFSLSVLCAIAGPAMAGGIGTPDGAALQGVKPIGAPAPNVAYTAG
jgi:hypothetical protein